MARHDDQPKKFLLGQVSFLTGQNIRKKVNLSLCNFLSVNMIVFFYKETKPKIQRQLGFGSLFEKRVHVVGQRDWRVKVLASLDAILDGHCPFTGRDMHFEP